MRALLLRLLDWSVSIAIAVAALFPILWGLSTSLKEPRRILATPPQVLPDPITFEHYLSIFKAGIHWHILNSVIVSAGTVILCLGIGTLAAFALARMQFRGKSLIMVLIVTVMSIPIASLLVPTFTLMAEAGLTNSRTGLILLYTAYQLPIAIWILYAYFQTIPVELEWSAMIDGYSRLEVIWKVVLPLSWPGIIAAGLFVLVFAWNDFVVAVTLLSSETVRTLPIGIYNFLGFYGREWGPLMAAAIVSIIPVMIVFVFFQRYFLSGMTGGSVKG